ncbi:Dual adapter for phosphotyrosine and 3-phosphotyrosine and 3-phosphoinositide [Camelus dromedarius]|uniref:Dual adapter for phosphotyrosine and 3-phosphotyrosine and 3-phosphoinositide n=1 Tax=Camelus dromedarius TaxID=9838 RepID=A0A5N4EHX0_CAMDR|nr:Dual adapter for phosphotyrosine and 3-phosphotyrosine and 3-phosphoinositide [Camelus dromedarius]
MKNKRLHNLATVIQLLAFGASSWGFYLIMLFHFHSGTLIVLKHPYPRKVEEPSIYESVRVHTAMQTGRTENDLVPTAPSLGTKEGYLTKQGGLVKTWKTRWFTLHRNELKYFKDQMVRNVIRFPFKTQLCRDYLLSIRHELLA